MRLPMQFELYIAARYLRAKRRQAVVGLVTLISVAGVAAGVAALVVALAITNGMQRDLQDRLLSSTAHVMLMRVKNDGIHNWRPLLERMRHLPHVTEAAPGMYEQVMVSHGPRDGFAMLKAIIPAQERTVSDLLSKITTGSAKELDPVAGDTVGVATAPINVAPPPLVIGDELAQTLGVSVGDAAMVVSPQGELTPLGVIPSFRPFRVVGIFHSGFYQYDSGHGVHSTVRCAAALQRAGCHLRHRFKVDDLNRAPSIAKEIEKAAGPGFQTITGWKRIASFSGRWLWRRL